ncbi:hypothetical protein [Streptomyces noursei]|uniref:hypothetical protein n=1 Tax=Streptomyces noursei TaxID=1971 RepID=UPI00045EE18B|nr:hypothetical protein [Streptomyces noursei]AIA02946.1 hypothetical protein DC74_2440 [Streptomyces noursei]
MSVNASTRQAIGRRLSDGAQPFRDLTGPARRRDPACPTGSGSADRSVQGTARATPDIGRAARGIRTAHGAGAERRPTSLDAPAVDRTRTDPDPEPRPASRPHP